MRMKVVFPPLNGAFQSSAHVCIIYSLARAGLTQAQYFSIFINQSYATRLKVLTAQVSHYFLLLLVKVG